MTAASELPPEAVAAIERGQKIEAIKITREALGIGLKEAKEAVERHQSAQPPALDDSRSERVPGSAGPVQRDSVGPGLRLLLVAVIVIALAALVYFL